MSTPDDPIARFVVSLTRARAGEAGDATAAALATVDASGRPSARIVLLKGIDTGFVFFTSYQSRKAGDLDVNPHAALCFYWPSLGEQVRVEGRVSRLTETESDAYFATRPRESQLSAWASPQSQTVGSREELEARWREIEMGFAGQAVPRPPFWGGYRLLPERVEFWHNRNHRLHDRWLYVRDGAGWAVTRLAP